MALTVCKCNRGSLHMQVHTRANVPYTYACIDLCAAVCTVDLYRVYARMGADIIDYTIVGLVRPSYWLSR